MRKSKLHWRATSVISLLLLLVFAPLNVRAQVSTTAFITVSQPSVAPGEFFSVRTGGGPGVGGLVFNFGKGVNVSGTPTCYSACGSVDINHVDGVINVNAMSGNMDVEIAFQVESSAIPGNWVDFTTTVVGGTPTIRMASTRVQISAPSRIVQEQSKVQETSVEAFAFAYPNAIVSSPSGSFYVEFGHYFSNADYPQSQEATLWITLPEGVKITDRPKCGRADLYSQLSECTNLHSSSHSGSPLVFFGPLEIVTLELQVEASAAVGILLEVDVKVRAPSVIDHESSLAIAVVPDDSLPSLSIHEKAVMIEIHDNFRPGGTGGCVPNATLDLSLYSYGDFGETLYATNPEVSSGTITNSLYDSSREVCRITFRFKDVPVGPERFVLGSTSEPGFLCRACIVGAILPTEHAIVVLQIGYDPRD